MQNKKRTKLRLALLLALQGVATAHAGDGFIKQPGLRKATVDVADSTMELEFRPSERHAAAATPLTTPVLDTNAALSSDSIRSLSQPAETATGRWVGHASAAPTTSSTIPQAHSDLRWVSRGPIVPPASASAASAPVVSPSASIVQLSKQVPSPNQVQTQAPSSLLNTPSDAIEIANPSFAASLRAPQFPPETTSQQTAQQPAQQPAEALAETPSERTIRASLISRRIIGADTADADHPPMAHIDSSPGWQAVGERLTRHLKACESHLRHNAFFSAREEAESAAIYLFRVLDVAGNTYTAEPEWLAAQQALNEVEDFLYAQRLSTDENLLERIVDSHQTQVLKSTDVRHVSPLIAAQHYRDFASESLVKASQGHPWASEIYYSMGRTFQAQAEESKHISDSLRWKAVTYYRAALAIAPTNAIASNQLGFILLQMDRCQDARQALIASLQAEVSEPGLENLVEVSRRLGDTQTHRWALQNLTALRQAQPPQTIAPIVTEVDTQTFIALSPYSIGPQPQADNAARIATVPHQSSLR